MSTLDRTFKISLALKGIDAILEVLGGIALALIGADRARHVLRVIAHDLSRDSHDFVARHILHFAGHLTTSTTTFAVVYLLSHGVTKLVLIVAVLRKQLWAYPALIVLLGAFILYQLYRMVEHFTVGMLLLTVFDVFVSWLTWLEYQKLRAGRARSWRAGNASSVEPETAHA